jgi:hypothetical protein
MERDWKNLSDSSTFEWKKLDWVYRWRMEGKVLSDVGDNVIVGKATKSPPPFSFLLGEGDLLARIYDIHFCYW